MYFRFIYDSNGNLIQKDQYINNVLYASVKYIYDVNQVLTDVRIITKQPATVVQNRKMVYNSNGDLIQIKHS